MTVIAIHSRGNRLDRAQRRELAHLLTLAVMEPELGQTSKAALGGFQVHFRTFATDEVAIGGMLLDDIEDGADLVLVDISVMDAWWPLQLREEVIRNVNAALLRVMGEEHPPRSWWVILRIVEEGSWAAGGRAVSIHDFVDAGLFAPSRAAEIRTHLPRRP